MSLDHTRYRSVCSTPCTPWGIPTTCYTWGLSWRQPLPGATEHGSSSPLSRDVLHNTLLLPYAEAGDWVDGLSMPPIEDKDDEDDDDYIGEKDDDADDNDDDDGAMDADEPEPPLPQGIFFHEGDPDETSPPPDLLFH
ncbi:unnamed protein product [Linum trigynum]|uniref:Uncharacterized protein n=1 Tax=Linum trigynum TaxID=586398 RepID=A0AAV2D6K6_9ROSI